MLEQALGWIEELQALDWMVGQALEQALGWIQALDWMVGQALEQALGRIEELQALDWTVGEVVGWTILSAGNCCQIHQDQEQ